MKFVDKEKKLRHIVLQGTPYERGETLGREAGDLVNKNVDYYLSLWNKYSKVDVNEVRSMASKFISPIKSYDPEIIEEMKGIADSTSHELEDIIAINARYEFVYSLMGLMSGKGPLASECASMGFSPEYTRTGHTIVSQNWDYIVGVENTCILFEEIQEPHKPNVLIHAEAGIIGHKGINSEGIGLTVNALQSSKDKFDPKVPLWVLARGALNKRSIGDAMFAIVGYPRSVSGNFMIGQKGGEVFDIELMPTDYGLISASNGYVVHTNHFTSFSPDAGFDITKSLAPNSVVRYYRALRKLSMRDSPGKITHNEIQSIYRDHFNEPNSICKHPDVKVEYDFRARTIASLILDLDSLSMYVTNGEPCRNEYNKVQIGTSEISQMEED